MPHIPILFLLQRSLYKILTSLMYMDF